MRIVHCLSLRQRMERTRRIAKGNGSRRLPIPRKAIAKRYRKRPERAMAKDGVWAWLLARHDSYVLGRC
jgi:hypothetical protein